MVRYSMLWHIIVEYSILGCIIDAWWLRRPEAYMRFGVKSFEL